MIYGNLRSDICMNSTRNRLVAPRNVVNTKMLYSFYILKELSKGEVIFGNKVLEAFRDVFQSSNLPFPVSSCRQTRRSPHKDYNNIPLLTNLTNTKHPFSLYQSLKSPFLDPYQL